MLSVIDTIHGQVHYTLRRLSARKRITIRISSGGGVSVSAPQRVSKKDIEDFLLHQADWVFEHVGKIVKKKLGDVPTTEYFMYLEKQKQDHIHTYRKSKKEALNILIQEVEEVNMIYGFTYTAIRVKNQKSRWGSCSRGGVLNFNYKVAYLSPEERKYVVAHEICHLKEFNHGPHFWQLVSKAVPNYKEVRKGLKMIY